MSDRLRENLNAAAIPFALVAHDGERFIGTASVIANDLPERPNYTPWVAAVWVDPEHRTLRVGSALVAHAAAACFSLGIAQVYLCAQPSRDGFYAQLGWTPIERGVGPRELTVWIRHADETGKR